MMATELHNLLVNRFVREIIGPAIRNGAADTDLMVLFESCQFGTMRVLAQHYDLRPSSAVGLMEASLQRSIERFTDPA